MSPVQNLKHNSPLPLRNHYTAVFIMFSDQFSINLIVVIILGSKKETIIEAKHSLALVFISQPEYTKSAFG